MNRKIMIKCYIQTTSYYARNEYDKCCM